MPTAWGFKSPHPQGYPSGQRRETVNLLRNASQVRILPPPGVLGVFLQKPHHKNLIFFVTYLVFLHLAFVVQCFGFDSGSE